MTKLVHIAHIRDKNGQKIPIFLYKNREQVFAWYLQIGGDEGMTEVQAPSIQEAFHLARRYWIDAVFTPMGCGYLYTLPERDEHGQEALFYQAEQSFASSSGIYFDEELGHSCIVQNIPSSIKRFFSKNPK